MDLVTVLGVALGLAMDAFAVSVAAGVALRRATARQTFRLAFHFGLFQALMPIAGWLAGLTLARWLGGLDAWAAFGLLAWIGGRMVLAGLRGGARDQAADPTRGLSLVALSVATSLDALAVGVSLGVLGVAIWGPALVIGLVAAALTAAGLHLARPLGRLGPRAGRAMEIAGGLVLVAIGLRILLEGGPR